MGDSILSTFLLNNLRNISPQFAHPPEDMFVKTVSGNPFFDARQNYKVLETSRSYILD